MEACCAWASAKEAVTEVRPSIRSANRLSVSPHFRQDQFDRVGEGFVALSKLFKPFVNVHSANLGSASPSCNADCATLNVRSTTTTAKMSIDSQAKEVQQRFAGSTDCADFTDSRALFSRHNVRNLRNLWCALFYVSPCLSGLALFIPASDSGLLTSFFVFVSLCLCGEIS